MENNQDNETLNQEDDSLEAAFLDVIMKFKLAYYQSVLKNFQSRKATLTADEAYSVEVIFAMGSSTVGDFAKLVKISPQSAAYKVNNLVKKGYLKKTRDSQDKREVRLDVTDRFMKYYTISNHYMFDVLERVKERFSKEDSEKLAELMAVIDQELTPEIVKFTPADMPIDELIKLSLSPEAEEPVGPPNIDASLDLDSEDSDDALGNDSDD